tara:strand:- start:7109 stop:8443 length:1335 start_codon:yes stop_codon:yes gene_type:complete
MKEIYTKESIKLLNNLLKNNNITVTQILDKSFERIQKYRTLTNSWIEVWNKEAYDIAEKLDKKKNNKNTNILFGIPIGLKDLINYKGKNTTQGIKNYNCFSNENAEIVKKILDLEMIPIGKQNLVEIAFGITGHNPSLGNIKNPLNIKYIPGGSSSGSVVSTVTGMTPISLGTDTGGSIRIPSSMCGAVGFKPTFGMLSLIGVKTLSESLDHLGVITNNVDDNKLFFQKVIGLKKNNLNLPKKLKILIPINKRFNEISSECVKKNFESFINIISKVGIDIEYMNMPWLDKARKITLDILLAEAYNNHKRKYEEKKVSKYILDRLKSGKNITIEELKIAKINKDIFTTKMEKILDKFDAIISPTIPIETPTIEESEPLKTENKNSLIAEFTSIYNLTGQPSITIPMGKDNNGLPMGVMISGKKHSDIKILNIAKLFEKLITENEK